MSSDSTRVLQTVGNYDLLSKIAEGGMGAVYRGRDRTTGLIVAVKIIPPDTAKNPLLLKRFEQEFRAASLINHPNVVRALDYSGHGGTPFLVMEFVDGMSLGAKVEKEGPVPEAEAIRIIGQVCEGLHRAHKQGLIHRDVKPDNILVTADGVAKLTDLGLVKDVEGEMNLTRTGRGLGTPHFMAPEQFRNAKNADARCDVYSLGATLYTVLTGDIPFAKTSPLDCWLKKTKNDFPEPRRLNPKLTERTNLAVLRAMSADPAARPASCREFMEDLIGAGWKAGSGLVAASPAGEVSIQISGGGDDIWYMVYRDENGQPRTVKGSTDSIRKNLMAGALGDETSILVSRTKTGQFLAVRSVPEFRDLVMGASGSFPGLPRPDTASTAGEPTSPGSGVRGGPRTAPPGSSSTRLPGGGSGPRPLPNPSSRVIPTGGPPNRAYHTGTTEYNPTAAMPPPSPASGPQPQVPFPGLGAGGRQKPDLTPWLVAVAAAVAGAVGAALFLR